MAIVKIAVLRPRRPGSGRSGTGIQLDMRFGRAGQGRYSTALRGAPGQFPWRSGAFFRWPTSTPRRSGSCALPESASENRLYTSTVKTHFRALEAHLAGGEAEAAQATHRELISTIDKAVKRGALHRNTGARKKSRAARLLAGK